MKQIKNYMVDISHWNAYPEIAIGGQKPTVMVKLTEGIGYVDPKANDHIGKAKADGVAYGVYHFVRADLNNQNDYEIEHFINNAKKYSPSMVALDVEAGSLRVNEIDRIVGYYVKNLLKAFPNIPVLIYCSANEASRFENLGAKLWVADWSSSTIENSAKRYLFNIGNVWGWQYTNNYNGSHLDVSYVYEEGDKDSFIDELLALLNKYNIR